MTLSIIVVEYHCLDDIHRSLASLPDLKEGEMELIVSSNSQYSPETKAVLQRNYPDVKWVFNERNGGFAYGMNRGLEQAKGEYMVIMNADCRLSESLDNMIDFMRRHPQVGAAGPRIVDGEGNLQDSCREYVTPWRFAHRQARRVMCKLTSVFDKGRDYSRVQTVDWVIGAFVMISRKAYEAVGGLDEDYFLYAEDMDWNVRMRLQGLETVYFPETEVIYKGTRSARRSFHYAKIFADSHRLFWKRYGVLARKFPKRRELEELESAPAAVGAEEKDSVSPAPDSRIQDVSEPSANVFEKKSGKYLAVSK